MVNSITTSTKYLYGHVVGVYVEFNYDGSTSTQTIGDSYSTTTDLKIKTNDVNISDLIIKNTHSTNNMVIDVYHSFDPNPADYTVNPNHWKTTITNFTVNANNEHVIHSNAATSGVITYYYIRVKNATAGNTATAKVMFNGR